MPFWLPQEQRPARDRARRYGVVMEIRWFEEPLPPALPVTQVYGWVLNVGGAVLVLRDGEKFTLPGGQPEAGETWQETLAREAWEEARVTVRDVRYLGYQRVSEDTAWFAGAPYAQLRFAARLQRESPTGPDPATGRTYQRHWLAPDAAVRALGWGGEQLGAAWRLLALS
ncbi:NUDIX domain-containing protein [Deinococcus peraridilitoris]|uniref:Zn-finger containing NTP pyrophosphohydrolase n=1 Tax=Deinococcus peraridilitoris (strain DSM 19664 / LMG 22246 / CIP 109416 / KR-200) TaxID=937777 RepID=K9ZXC9_DEIPD|nr:NUDIX domain-containing protein [Deinococcus peraridilitoris]AFZ66226.1 Zn-finger containing NTP pyrophosphohydrolase [Deinococcus peraridilitoris DSM 19664]